MVNNAKEYETFSAVKNHEFIYVTDGKGWDSDKFHL